MISREPLSIFFTAETIHPEFWELEPEILREISGFSHLDCEKALVCQIIFHNHCVFTEWNVFEKVCCVLNDRPANFLLSQELYPSEILYAYHIIRGIDPKSPFSQEVLSHICCVFANDGLMMVPEIMKKEIGDEGISIEFTMRLVSNVEKLDSEQEKVQKLMLGAIEKYVQARLEKSSSEIEALRNQK